MEYVIKLIKYPTSYDWYEVKRRALVTANKNPKNPPDLEWEKKILKARHSPIRYLQFSFYLEIPYWVSVHLCRHIHAQPYVQSQRNDRQDMYDRNEAPQNEPVRMIWDINAEELCVIANKRLCTQASKETRDVVSAMCELVKMHCPEFEDELVPMCVRENGCREMYPCGRWNR